MLLNIIVSTFSLAGLWVLFYWPYRSYRKDRLRTELFALRQELFDMARLGEVDFSHPAYALSRTTINGFIRVGHQLNLVGAAVFASPLGPAVGAGEPYYLRMRRLSADLPEATRERLEDILGKLNFLILDHVVFTSLSALVLVIPILVMMALRFWFRSIKKACGTFLLQSSFAGRMDSAALAVGGE